MRRAGVGVSGEVNAVVGGVAEVMFSIAANLTVSARTVGHLFVGGFFSTLCHHGVSGQICIGFAQILKLWGGLYETACHDGRQGESSAAPQSHESKASCCALGSSPSRFVRFRPSLGTRTANPRARRSAEESRRSAGAADCHLRGTGQHRKFTGQIGACIQSHAGQGGASLRRQNGHPIPIRKRRLPHGRHAWGAA